MNQYLIYGGMAALVPQLYTDVSAALFSDSSGKINLPGIFGGSGTTSVTWMAYLALAGLLFLLVGLFL